jgi:hypothetical protein
MAAVHAGDTVLIARVRAEFLYLPGLKLTPAQACRLWGLSESRCYSLLESLIDAGFLQRSGDGSYSRALPVGRPD